MLARVQALGREQRLTSDGELYGRRFATGGGLPRAALPGGALHGRRGLMGGWSAAMAAARSHMSRDLLTVTPDDGLIAVAGRMVERDVGAVPVLEGERLVGIFTERDIMRAVAGGIGADTVVADYMTPGPRRWSRTSRSSRPRC